MPQNLEQAATMVQQAIHIYKQAVTLSTYLRTRH